MADYGGSHRRLLKQTWEFSMYNIYEKEGVEWDFFDLRRAMCVVGRENGVRKWGEGSGFKSE